MTGDNYVFTVLGHYCKMVRSHKSKELYIKLATLVIAIGTSEFCLQHTFIFHPIQGALVIDHTKEYFFNAFCSTDPENSSRKRFIGF